MLKSAFFQSVIYVVLGVLLAYFTFKNVSFSELKGTMLSGNYWIAIPVFFISVTGYYARISRWQLSLKSMHETVDKPTLFASLCIGYGINYAVPRLGELSRCLLIKKSHNITLEKSLVSVVYERVIDTVVLFILLAVLLLTLSDKLMAFVLNNAIKPFAENISTDKILILFAGALLVIALLFFLGKKLAHKFNGFRESFRQMIQATFSLKYLLQTIIIWLCYYLMTYLWFFTFDETKQLGLYDAYVLMIVGSVGRSVPIQGGGLGAYHFLVSQAAVILGLTLVSGNALAIVIHGVQSIFTIILALISYLSFFIKYRTVH